MPLYAKYEVCFLWLVDPRSRTLESYELIQERWSMTGVFKDAEKVRVSPFDEIDVNLSELWVSEGA